MRRRDFLNICGSGLVVLGSSGVASASFGKKDLPATNKKIIWVMLRGGMDSLHAIAPTFDKDLMTLRADLLKPIESTLQPLERGYKLHPAFKNLHQMYKSKELLPIVAVASGQLTRSHFEAQDLLESGLSELDHNSGWLARAMVKKEGKAIALARSVPISLRAHDAKQFSRVNTWYPSNLPDADEGLFDLLGKLYEGDEALMQGLMKGMETRESLGMTKTKRARANFPVIAKYCADLVNKNPEAHCAMMEMGGWDTHNNQVGRLQNQFTQLDKGLATIKSRLGKEWKNTIVVVATEFGRTAAVNGTRGTDHGTASALLLAGGAVQGGRVLGEWPGLDKNSLYQGRDLSPTSDIRSWLAAVLKQHWGMSTQALQSVFPDVTVANVPIVRT